AEGGLRRHAETLLLDEAQHGKKPEGTERAALDQPQVVAHEHAVPLEHRAPAEEIAERRELPLEEAADPLLLAEVIDEDHFAAGGAHALELAHYPLGVRHHRHH